MWFSACGVDGSTYDQVVNLTNRRLACLGTVPRTLNVLRKLPGVYITLGSSFVYTRKSGDAQP